MLFSRSQGHILFDTTAFATSSTRVNKRIDWRARYGQTDIIQWSTNYLSIIDGLIGDKLGKNNCAISG